MSERMTAEQAWAEYDRLVKASDDVDANPASTIEQKIAAVNAFDAQGTIAEAIGPRPVKPLPESACRHRACDGSGRTATGDGKFQLCICLVPE